MTHYAVIGRIPFDDEDSIMFYDSDEENPPLAEWFERDTYDAEGREDMEEVRAECGAAVHLAAILKSDTEIDHL